MRFFSGNIDHLLKPSTIQEVRKTYKYYEHESIGTHLCIELDGDLYEWKRL